MSRLREGTKAVRFTDSKKAFNFVAEAWKQELKVADRIKKRSTYLLQFSDGNVSLYTDSQIIKRANSIFSEGTWSRTSSRFTETKEAFNFVAKKWKQYLREADKIKNGATYLLSFSDGDVDQYTDKGIITIANRILFDREERQREEVKK